MKKLSLLALFFSFITLSLQAQDNKKPVFGEVDGVRFVSGQIGANLVLSF